MAANVDFHHPELASAYDRYKISPRLPRALRHGKLKEHLKALQARFPDQLRLEKAGESVEGRDIFLVSIGRGVRRVMLWSQMHGNEPTATSALLDIIAYLLQQQDQPFVRELLDGVTLYAIPMLNPDGAEYDQRRNVQGLDINRDARDLASPEARLLKSVRDRLNPDFGFNLHDQNGRRTVGNTNKLVAIALLVPPVDENENDTPNTIEAKKVASVMCHALSPYVYGHIARYDASFMSRAFGENMQIWGTRTVLIESGGWFEGKPDYLVKLNFIAILEACHAIATNHFASANPVVYDALPQNDKELFDFLVKDALILDGIRSTPFKGDIGINYTEIEVGDALVYRGRITDIGDMDIFAAKHAIDASGLLAVPGLIGLLPQPNGEWSPALATTYLARGYTTLLLHYNVASNVSLAARIAALESDPAPVNRGFVVALRDLRKILPMEQATCLGDALSDGALAVLRDDANPKELHHLTYRIIKWLHRQTAGEEELLAAVAWPELFAEQGIQVAARRAASTGLHERGRIRVGDFADIALYRFHYDDDDRLRIDELEYVLVNGRVAFAREGNTESTDCGIVLCH